MVLGTIVLFGTVNAWGGLFNRFSPDALASFVEDPHRSYYQVKNIYSFSSFSYIFICRLFQCCDKRNGSSKRIYFS